MSIATHERTLNELIVAGRPLDAFERFYAEDVTMQEKLDPPTVGKAANRAREDAFFAGLTRMDSTLLGAAVDGDRSWSEWKLALTFRDGSTATVHQVAARTWRDGQVVQERFYAI